MDAETHIRKRYKNRFNDKWDRVAKLFDYYDMTDFAEDYHQAKSKEGTVMLSDIEIENLAAKRWKRLNRRKPKMKEGKRQFAIRAFKAGYKAAFGKEGEG